MLFQTTVVNLTYFSFTSYRETTNEYDSYVLPLIRQMKYLEDFILHIVVSHRSTFIDGTHLNNEILIYLPQVQIYTFNIYGR